MKLIIIVCPPKHAWMSVLVCFNCNMCVAYFAHPRCIIFLTLLPLRKWLNPTNSYEVARLHAECAFSLSEQASSSSAKSGKTCKWGGREMCSILILHGWHILWNEWELFSVPLLPLPVFFLHLKKHHHLRCGQKQWILARLHLLMKKNKPLVPSVVWIPSKLRLSLIGLKEWKPERINGFCWSVQGWTQRKWQCMFVCLCLCVSVFQPLRVRKN